MGGAGHVPASPQSLPGITDVISPKADRACGLKRLGGCAQGISRTLRACPEMAVVPGPRPPECSPSPTAAVRAPESASSSRSGMVGRLGDTCEGLSRDGPDRSRGEPSGDGKGRGDRSRGARAMRQLRDSATGAGVPPQGPGIARPAVTGFLQVRLTADHSRWAKRSVPKNGRPRTHRNIKAVVLRVSESLLTCADEVFGKDSVLCRQPRPVPHMMPDTGRCSSRWQHSQSRSVRVISLQRAGLVSWPGAAMRASSVICVILSAAVRPRS
jgi:hypothetical protein